MLKLTLLCSLSLFSQESSKVSDKVEFGPLVSIQEHYKRCEMDRIWKMSDGLSYKNNKTSCFSLRGQRVYIVRTEIYNDYNLYLGGVNALQPCSDKYQKPRVYSEQKSDIHPTE